MSVSVLTLPISYVFGVDYGGILETTYIPMHLWLNYHGVKDDGIDLEALVPLDGELVVDVVEVENGGVIAGVNVGGGGGGVEVEVW